MQPKAEELWKRILFRNLVFCTCLNILLASTVSWLFSKIRPFLSPPGDVFIFRVTRLFLLQHKSFKLLINVFLSSSYGCCDMVLLLSCFKFSFIPTNRCQQTCDVWLQAFSLQLLYHLTLTATHMIHFGASFALLSQKKQNTESELVSGPPTHSIPSPITWSALPPTLLPLLFLPEALKLGRKSASRKVRIKGRSDESESSFEQAALMFSGSDSFRCLGSGGASVASVGPRLFRAPPAAPTRSELRHKSTNVRTRKNWFQAQLWLAVKMRGKIRRRTQSKGCLRVLQGSH